jgi:hypothetical protein
MRKHFIALLCLIFSASALPAQTIDVYCPQMPIHRVRLGVWQTGRENCVATVKIFGEPDLIVPHDVIAPTFVRGGYVAPCQAIGTAADGSKLVLNLPAEAVTWTRPGVWTAQQMTATGTLTRPTGKVWNVTVIYPACPARFVRRGLKMADALTAKGTLTPNGTFEACE